MEWYSIKVENLTKVYKIYDKSIDRLKESLNPLKKKMHREFYALNNVSFEVKKGETIGIIGQNGAGKSTLLKILTGVLSASSGSVDIKGKVSALLELGAGFNPEYTGIENIYLNGTIMGYTEEEIDKKVNNIIEFADIGEFIYQPVKNYSSGMFARLAFAVAINVDPDILIVDEALSVGDIFFQNKCYKKFNELQEKGITIIFVSHDIGSVKQYCNRVVWIENGVVKEFDDKEVVCSEYINEKIKKQNEHFFSKESVDKQKLAQTIKHKDNLKIYPKLNKCANVGGTKEAQLISFFIEENSNNIVVDLKVDNEYTFNLVAKFDIDIDNVLFGFVLENLKGIPIYATNNYINDNVLSKAKKGKIYKVSFQFKIPKIYKGKYLLSPAIATGTQEENYVLAWYHNLLEINIENNGYNLALIEIDNKVDVWEFDEEEIVLN